MTKRFDEFEHERFSAGAISPVQMIPDEQRSFNAHCQLALHGHANTFELHLKARLSAALVVDQKGASGVKTMGIEDYVRLFILPAGHVTPKITIREMDEEGGVGFTTFSRLEDGSVLRTFPDYSTQFPSKHEYVRAVILDWAQKQFSAGIAHMSRSQMFDRMAFNRLTADILSGVRNASETLVFVARREGGTFYERSTPPRLVFTETDRSSKAISLKLAARGVDVTNNWVGLLTSVPAELASTGSRLRYAIMNASAYFKNELDEIDATWDDDRVWNGSSISRKDRWNFEDAVPAETRDLFNAARRMSKDILDFRTDGGFSKDVLEVARWFASYPSDATDGVPEGWSDRLERLWLSMEAEPDTCDLFCGSVGWPLKHPVTTVLRARHNLVMGNDLSQGLYETSAPAVEASNKP